MLTGIFSHQHYKFSSGS